MADEEEVRARRPLLLGLEQLDESPAALIRGVSSGTAPARAPRAGLAGKGTPGPQARLPRPSPWDHVRDMTIALATKSVVMAGLPAAAAASSLGQTFAS